MYADHFDFTVPLYRELDDVLPAPLCAAVIARAEAGPWLPATVSAAAGRVVDRRVRDANTAVLDDDAVTARLWASVAARVPPTMTALRDGRRERVAAVGLHRPPRVYRYRVGQRFGPHHDQSYAGPGGARSLLTLLVYLDDGCDGGETELLEPGVVVTPRAGAALWFQHMLLHAGRPVRAGVKHVLRTDVLYAPESA